MLVSGARRSATLRGLLSRFERTKWLVFLTQGQCPEATAVACLFHTVAFYEGEPYLRVVLDSRSRRHPDNEIGSIAHELQHALEAAEAPEVVDAASLGALFRRIGRTRIKAHGVTTYETAAAVDVGEQVVRELRSSSLPPSTHANAQR